MMRLRQEQKETIQSIGRSYDLRFIILHGSYAVGTPRQGSDIDIALVGNRRLSFETVLAIQGTLGDIFGDTRERELDVKTLRGADSLFRYEVVKNGALLYGDRTEYDEFRAYPFAIIWKAATCASWNLRF